MTGERAIHTQTEPRSGLQRKLAALFERRPKSYRGLFKGNGLRASFATVDVTPDRPLPLFGFAFRREPFSTIASTIELNAVVLRWRDRTLVLVTGDFLYFSDVLRNAIVEAYGARHGFGAAEVLLGASHTHFAPAIDASKPGLGRIDDGYRDFVHEKALTQIGELLNAAGEEATIRHHRRPSRHNCNRRSLVIHRDGKEAIDDIMSDPGNVFDDALDVLRFDGPDGCLRGAMVRYACHPTSFTEKLALTAEFPGVIRGSFRAAAGRHDLPVLFFQGFAGDMVPINPAREELNLASPTGRLRPVKRQATLPAGQWEEWASSLAADARLALDMAREAAPIVPLLSACERHVALSELIEGLAEEHREQFMSMQAIELSAELLIVALSAEPTAAWTELISDLAPGKTVLPVGYVNQTYGYLPASRELVPDGYMAGGFFAPFGLTGRFRPDLEQRVIAGLDALFAPLVRADATAYRQRVAAMRKQINHLRSERELARALYLTADAQLEADPAGDIL